MQDFEGEGACAGSRNREETSEEYDVVSTMSEMNGPWQKSVEWNLRK